jgi:GNAT superfamily N-acetyltransferase
MAQGYVVVDAAPSDVEAIAAFQTACWREAYRGLVPDDYLDGVTEDDRALRWRDRLESGSRHAAIAWSGDGIAGVVSWGAADSGMPLLELKSLYVGQPHRGTGLAADLTARAIGDRPAQLWVFEGNARAQTFYRKLGFSPDGTGRIDPDTTVWEIRLIRKTELGYGLDMNLTSDLGSRRSTEEIQEIARRGTCCLTRNCHLPVQQTRLHQ